MFRSVPQKFIPEEIGRRGSNGLYVIISTNPSGDITMTSQIEYTGKASNGYRKPPSKTPSIKRGLKHYTGLRDSRKSPKRRCRGDHELEGRRGPNLPTTDKNGRNLNG